MKTSTHAVRLSVMIAVAALGFACTSRERRPVVTAPAPGAQDSAKPDPAGPTPNPDANPDSNPNIVPPPATSTPTPTPTADPQVVPNTNTNTNTDQNVIVIPSTDANGQPEELRWDGKSFQGNFKWDVQGL